MQRLTQLFQSMRSAQSKPRLILKGVRKKHYMVYTSADIAFGYWFTRKWDWLYRLIMKIANKVLVAAVRKKQGTIARFKHPFSRFSLSVALHVCHRGF